MRVAALLCLWAVASAAQAASPLGRVVNVAMAPVRYTHDRVKDLFDVFEVSLGAGRGAKVDVKYGVQLFGLGDTRPWRLGNIDRRMGLWRELDTELALFPFHLVAWPVHAVAKWTGCRSLASDTRFLARTGGEGVQHLDRKELNGDVAFFWKDTVSGYRHTRWGDSFPIGAEVHALVGARAMVRPLQLADFVVGFVGIDLDPQLNARP